jgi:hypothetical protein
VEELDRLLDELTRSVAALNQVSKGVSLPEDDFTVSDEDAIVRVSAKADGIITGIRVAPNWAAKISDDDLPIRINSVLALASFRAMGMRLPDGAVPARVASSGTADAPQPDVVSTAGDRETAERIADRAYQELVARVDDPARSEGAALERFYRNVDAFDAVMDGTPAGEAPTTTAKTEPDGPRIPSANGAVSAAMTPFGIGDVRFRDGWLKGTSGNVVTTCLAEILDRTTQSGNDLAEALRDIARFSRTEAPDDPQNGTHA